MDDMLISEIKDQEIFIALKRICSFIAEEPWRTSGDTDYNYAVTKSKEYKRDIEILADIDLETGWGQIRHKTKGGKIVSKHVGDLNPWYEGDLLLEDLLSSLEPIYENYLMSSPNYLPEIEFMHYYDFLSSKLPSSTKQKITIELDNLHPKILEHCEGLFYDGHYSEAIINAYKAIFNALKDLTNIHDIDGKQLAEKAFSLNDPLVKLNNLRTKSDKDEQLGFMMLFSGAAVGIRNPKSHDFIKQDDKLKTLQYLSFASLLMDRLDGRKT